MPSSFELFPPAGYEMFVARLSDCRLNQTDHHRNRNEQTTQSRRSEIPALDQATEKVKGYCTAKSCMYAAWLFGLPSRESDVFGSFSLK
jgi:hypothetical protein